MCVPYDEELGINPQDDAFLDREAWDLDGTPADKYPLLLHFHPLVIYRHQVLKQADVVLAMFLRGDEFSRRAEAPQLRLLRPDHHRRLDTVGLRAGDHGRRGRATPSWRCDYFREALYVDLADTHGNTDRRRARRSTGGVWAPGPRLRRHARPQRA